MFPNLVKKYYVFLPFIVIGFVWQIVSVELAYASICSYTPDRGSGVNTDLGFSLFSDAQDSRCRIECENNFHQQENPTASYYRCHLDNRLLTDTRTAEEQGRQVQQAQQAALKEEQRAAAEASIPSWTCVRKYHNPIKGRTKEVGAENHYCVNLQKPIDASSESRARFLCYRDCESKLDFENKPYQCDFYNTRTCSNYPGSEGGEGGKLNDFAIEDLKSGVNKLNKLGDATVSKLISRLIGVAMGILGTIAIAVLLYGGVLWMTARGNSQSTEKALQLLLWGGLGVVVILTSFAIVQFIFGAFT